MGVLVNTIIIIVSSWVGTIVKSGISAKLHERLMQGMALSVIAIGIDGLLTGDNTIVLILSMVLGTVIGESIDIDARLTRFITNLEAKYAKSGRENNLGQGFIAGAMIFCVGSMSILGSLESGLTGDNTTLYTKSILDGITALLLSSSLGFGVMLSAVAVFFVEGSLVLLAEVAAPILSQAMINEIIAVGSLLLIGLGTNILNLTQLKILNHTPAMFLPVLLMLIMK
ncbi:DUF554 domain-containing protein [Facklamia sp. DSM 111018]|uniref:DUF554 domain-containing protein n=1 Tax=Facklamia lactis TaxID=2749967 RepID=A0ABS0LPP7_9LACT|nr:DUF554 domain-containing protein [Facklamia lactis]MBG9980175.1 DUF554 domain-containing protein [Facklamia lactis]MBG9985977.1 DUF554 domain-containing protein [Facklamia lactis]